MESRADSHGFEELPHTADWAMRVWAEDLPALFVQAALGMYALSGTRVIEGPTLSRRFEAQAVDPESLLVAFLSELVFLQERENLGFTHFDVRLDGSRLAAKMEGGLLESLDKPIKAVTFHNLHITHNDEGYEVQIVFDV